MPAETEIRFKDFADSGSDWLWEMDENLQFIWMSDHISEILPFPTGDIIGKTCKEAPFCDPSDDKWRQHLAKMDEHLAFKNFEFSHQFDDDQYFHVSISGKPVFDSDHNFRGYRGVGRDITTQKNIEKALNRAESLYRAIVENQTELVSRFTPDGKFTFLNDAFCEFLGKNREDLIGTSIYADIDEAYVPEIETLLSGFEPNVPSRSNKSYRRRIDGEYRLIEWDDFPIAGSQNNIIEIQSVGRDITERHRNELEIAEKTKSLQLLERIATAANEAQDLSTTLEICVAEICRYLGWPVGHVYLVNEAAESKLCSTSIWYRKRPEEFQNFYDVTEKLPFQPGIGLPGRVYSSAKPAWIQDVTKDNNFPRAKMADIGLKTGFGFPILVSEKPVGVIELFSPNELEPNQEAIRVMVHIGEVLGRVIERDRAEDELRKNQEQFRDYAEMAADWFWEMGPDLKFTYFSDRIETITGIPASYFVGKSRDATGVLDADQDKWIQHLQDLEDRKPFYDFRYSRADVKNRVQYVQTSGRPIFDDDGAFLGYRGTATDITGEMTALRSLQAAKESAEYANHSKTAFLANMSHELRTPLNAIIGFSEIMTTGALGVIENETHVGYVNDIHQAGTHLLEVINEILDVARIESGEIDLHEESIDLREVCEACERMVRTRAAQNKITIEIIIPSEFPLLYADHTRVKQTILNLLINAVKFNQLAGTVTISAKTDEKNRIIITVSDTGIGIEPNALATIFEPFTQVHDVFTRPHEGSGLGLSLVKLMTEKHGGSVEIESQAGKGTTITISYPPARTKRLD